MPKIMTVPSTNTQGRNSVSLLLSRDALFLDADGIPSPGIELSPEQARSLGERLLLLAQEAASPPTSQSRTQSAAILILHDGTKRGDRAFALALAMARD